MLSKAQIKHITALRTKKYRTEHSQFFVEGNKSIEELLKSSFQDIKIFYTKANEDFIAQNDRVTATLISTIEYEKVSALKNGDGLLALAQMPTEIPFAFNQKKYIALDQIRDPGNFGTIIRLADWYGIREIICSQDCVELYNPKVIQASMGSIFRVKISYVQLAHQLKYSNLPTYAAMLTGQSVYDTAPLKEGILVMGNEANGITPEVLQHCNHQITIPQNGDAESLNVAMACGILCSYLFR